MTTRHIEHWMVLSLAIIVGWGCREKGAENAQLKPNATSPARVSQSSDRGPKEISVKSKAVFERFVMSTSHPPRPIDALFDIRADGAMVFIGSVFEEKHQRKAPKTFLEPVWHRYETTLDSQVMAQISATIDSINPSELEAQYIDKNKWDGWNSNYLFKDSESEHHISCVNKRPEKLEDLTAFLNQTLRLSTDELRKAPVITLAEAKAYWEPLLKSGKR